MRIRALGIPIALAALLIAGATAESQLAKRGSFSVEIWWQAHGQWFAISQDRAFFVGEMRGTLFNEAGDGFLHRASVVCPSVRDVVRNAVNAHGYCLVTDEEQDTATFAWKCEGRAARCDGDGEWVSGTGKYRGITGRHTVSGEIRAADNPQAERGSGTFKGTWRLPD